MVEDAAEEFQKVQDICLSRALARELTSLSETGVTKEESKIEFHKLPEKITTTAQVTQAQLNKDQVRHLATVLKLHPTVIL